MAKVTWKGSALLAPLPPVMVTCGEGDTANIITVAWAGIINTHPPRVSISVRPVRHSYKLIKESGEFVINLTPASLIAAADYCGMYTGAKVDKFTATGLHKEAADVVACPMIAECPLCLECKVIDVIPQGTHDLFLAEVVATHVDDALLDEQGKLCLDRAGLAAFAHGAYYALGGEIGRFGFSVTKENKRKQIQTSRSVPVSANTTTTPPKKPRPPRKKTQKRTSR